jgi:hypothetical protein
VSTIGSGVAHEAEQNDQVQKQRQVGVDARAPVIDEHEGHDHQHADDGGRNALANGVGAQRSAHGAVFKKTSDAGSAPVRSILESSIDFVWREAALDLAAVAGWRS